MAPRTDWNPLLRDEFTKPYWAKLQRFVADERAHYPVYPPHDLVFNALHLTPHAAVKVVILGQDPYHGRGQAHGLCFSVPDGVPQPPSLRNILVELESDLGITVPRNGNLECWADQGVLLLNATLTVRAGKAGSHQRHGWETFTDEVIRTVNAKEDTRRVHPLGRGGPPQTRPDRHRSARDHRVGAPLAVVGCERLLRLATVQSRQRRARRGRA